MAYIHVKAVILREMVLNGRLVTADTIQRTAHLWENIPVTINHPPEGVSVRDRNAGVNVVGYIVSASFSPLSRSLEAEIALDTSRIDKEILDRIQKGQKIEVSTGYYAHSIPESGEFNGEPYSAVDIIVLPDHLAILPDAIGACSISAGCGIVSRPFTLLSQNAKIEINVTGNLPEEAKAIYEKVYREALERYKDESIAAKVAWEAVKRAGWRKQGDKWVRVENNESQEEPMEIHEKLQETLALLQRKFASGNTPDQPETGQNNDAPQVQPDAETVNALLFIRDNIDKIKKIVQAYSENTQPQPPPQPQPQNNQSVVCEEVQSLLVTMASQATGLPREFFNGLPAERLISAINAKPDVFFLRNENYAKDSVPLPPSFLLKER